jgi:DNA invertase Pin-like site-specific DNA recombinase
LKRVYYIRISDDRQDNLRQVEGLKDWAKNHGDNIADSIWEAALKKESLPLTCPVQWDWGSRDMAETRESFQGICKRIERQDRNATDRIAEVVIYELDRFGVEGPEEWFYYVHHFKKRGCHIISAMKGNLSLSDTKTLIESLFAAMTSREEQKNTAGRVADAKVHIAEKGGRDRLGGIAPFGYDRCCVDATGRVLFRIHYLEVAGKGKKGQPCERLVIHYDDAGHEVRRQVVKGEGETPRPTRSQHWKLFPSIDADRIQAVQLIFKWVKEEHPVLGLHGVCKRLANMGLKLYQGRAFHCDAVAYILRMPEYIGYWSYGKRQVARHKTHIPGQGRVDVPDHERGKCIWRSQDQWVLSPERTHEAIIDDETYRVVQEKLAARPKRTAMPRSERGFLKPVLYCGGCGRQMTCWTPKGKLLYRCPSYQLRYQNPGDSRYLTPCGVNAVPHDEVWAFIRKKVGAIRSRADLRNESAIRAEMLDEMFDNQELLYEVQRWGLKGYLSALYKVFRLGDENYDSALEREVFAVWEDNIESNFDRIPPDVAARIDRLERAKTVLARQLLDQLETEHRKMTLERARCSSERQRGVLDDELSRIEERIGELETALVPMLKHVERLEDKSVELGDRILELEKMINEGGNRMQGAAVGDLFERVVLHFEDRTKQPRKRTERGHVWVPERTVFVPKHREDEVVIAEKPDHLAPGYS